MTFAIRRRPFICLLCCLLCAGALLFSYSEAVRGVNTYTDYAGRSYEADVSYDHIYRYNDTFVGSMNGGLELGSEWEELKKK